MKNATDQLEHSGQEGGGAGSGGPGPTGRRGPSRLHLVVLTVLVVVAGAFAVTAAVHHRQQQNLQATLRPSGIPSSVSTSIATLMQLSPVKVVKAPGFSFVDQYGKPVSLAGLRGKVVVLEFMDPHCTDICPIVSKEFVDASHDLGPLNSKVVFMAINVNQYYPSVASMAAFSKAHGLDSIPSWHFVTGPVPALQRAWKDYGITVEAPNPKADIIHTSVVYFINPSGQERYLAAPVVDHTAKGVSFLPAQQIRNWGKGIALVAKHLAS